MKLELISDIEQVQIGTNKCTSYYSWGDVEIKSLKQAQAKLTAQQIYEWGNEICPHQVKHRECPICWQKLKEGE